MFYNCSVACSNLGYKNLGQGEWETYFVELGLISCYIVAIN